MKTALAVITGLLVATSAFAGPVVMNTEQLDKIVAGATPNTPGGFGTDRAYIIQNVLSGGGAEWGQIAADRAGTNGYQNQNYMVTPGYLSSGGDLPAGVTPGLVK